MSDEYKDQRRSVVTLGDVNWAHKRIEELEAKLTQQDDLVQAAVAAALREAAEDVSAVSMDGEYLAERILALIPKGEE